MIHCFRQITAYRGLAAPPGLCSAHGGCFNLAEGWHVSWFKIARAGPIFSRYNLSCRVSHSLRCEPIMRFISQSFRTILVMVSAGAAVAAAGCGGGASMLSPAQVPVTVSLTHSTINLLQDGTAVIDPITIVSSSETALVIVSGLPAGVQVKYASTDTNPSGTLTFTAGAESQAGTSMPTVTVYSAGQTASTAFTLIVG